MIIMISMLEEKRSGRKGYERHWEKSRESRLDVYTERESLRQADIEKELRMRNKLFKKTDKYEEKQGSVIERKSEMNERSYKDRHADGQIYR